MVLLVTVNQPSQNDQRVYLVFAHETCYSNFVFTTFRISTFYFLQCAHETPGKLIKLQETNNQPRI